MHLTDALRQDLASALRGLRPSPVFAVIPTRQEPAAQKHRALPDPAFPSCQKWAPSFLSFTPP